MLSRLSETNSTLSLWPEPTASFQVSKVDYTTEDVDKGAYPHYMLKEIFEQPNAIRDAMRGRLSSEECTAKLGGLNMSSRELRDVDRIVLTACGTALHAARVGRMSDRKSRPYSD